MRFAIAFLLGLSGLSLAGCDRQKAQVPQGEAPVEARPATKAELPTGRLDRSHAGTAAPDVEFEDPEGAPVSLADFRGKPLLVNLWATWCAPCVVEMPSLDALAEREGERIHVLALSQDLEGRAKVTDFFRARNFRMLEPFLDSQLGLMTALGIGSLPTTILYDGQGREVWRMTGMEDWEGERARRLLREADAR